MKPLVSVILPCYNAGKYLEQALDSIINQSYQNIEILLVDDGSTDNSENIYKRYQQQESRLKIHKNLTNIGLINTLNHAINLAEGDYIARMDADDISELNRIEKQVNFLQNNPDISILGTGAIPIDKNGNKQDIKEEVYLHSTTIQFSALFTQPLFHGSIIAKSSVLKSNTYSLDYKHSEDFELWLRILSLGHQIANLPDALYLYRNNPDGVSNNNTLLQEQSHNKASKQYIEKLLNRELSTQVVSILNNRPESIVTHEQFKHSITILNEIKQLANSSNEINLYFIRQKINIAIQAMKRTKKITSYLYIIFFLLSIIGRSKIGFVYLLNKLRT